MNDITAYQVEKDSFMSKKADKDNQSSIKYKLTKKRPTPKLALEKNCIDVQESTRRLGFKTKISIFELIKKGEFPNSFKASGKWWIPISDIEDYEKSTKQFSLKYLNTSTRLVTRKI